MASAMASYGEEDNANVGIIEFFNKLKLGVFGLLYTMSKSADEGYWFSIIWFLVEFFQVLSFHFPLAFELSLELKEVFGWQSYTDWLGYFSAVFHLIPFIVLNQVATTVFFASSLFVVSGMVSISLFVIVQFTLNNFKTMWTLKLLRATAEIMFGPLYIPCLAFISQILVCHNGHSLVFTCWTASHLSIIVISSIMGLIYILIALLYSATFYSRDPTSGSLVGRPHSRVQTLQLFVNTIFTLAFIFGETAHSGQWFLPIMLFVGNFSIAYLYYKRMPYYYYDFNVFRFIGSVHHCWASVCIFINMLFPSHSNAVSILYFVLTPIFMYACNIMMQKRKLFLKKCNIAELRSEYEVELKGRFIMENVTAYMRLRNEEYGLYLNEEAIKFEVGYTYQPLPSYPRTSDEHDEIRIDHENSIDEVENLYSDGIRRFPVAMMALLRAEKEIASALHTLAKAESFSPVFDESFSIYALRMTYAELDEVNQKDIFSYISFQKYQEIARKEDEKATVYQLRFWNELMKSSPDLIRLHELSAVIHVSMNMAHDAFKKLVKLNPLSEKILRSYASFMIDVLNSSDEAAAMLRRADELEENAIRNNRDSEATTSGFLGDRMAIVTITGSPDRLGDIIDVNTGVVRLIARSDLLSMNVSRLMPSPIHHTTLLRNYQETGKSKMLNFNNFVIGLHKNGYLLPVEFFMREVAGSLDSAHGDKNSSYVAVMKAAPFQDQAIAKFGAIDKDDFTRIQPTMKIEFLYVDPSFNITFCTPGCTSILGISLEMITSGLKIASLIEGFESRLAEFQTSDEDGVIINLKIFPDNILISCNCRVILIRVLTDYYYLVQLIIQPNAVSKARYDPNASKNFTSSTPRANKGSILSHAPSAHNLTPTHSGRNTPKHNRRSFTQDNSVDISKILTSMPVTPGKKSIVKSVDSPAFKSDSFNVLRPSFEMAAMDDGSLKIDTTPRNVTTRLSTTKLLSETPKDFYLSNKDKDPGTLSQHSGGGSSQGSRTSTLSGTSTMHARLNNFSKSSQSQGLGSGLKTLLIMLLASLAFSSILSIVKFVVTDSMTSTYTEYLNDSYYGARMRFLTARIVYNVRALTYSPKTNFAGYIVSAEINDYKTSLANDCAEFQTINNAVIVDRSAYLTQAHYDLYVLPNVQVTSQIHTVGSLLINISKMSLWNAVKTFIASTKSVISLNADDIVNTNEDVYFVLENGIGPLFTYLNTSAFMYNVVCEDYVVKMYIVLLTITLVSIFSMLFVIIFFVKPTVWLIEDNKHEVLLLFTEIPLAIIRGFKLRCEERILRLQREREEFQKESVEEGGFSNVPDTSVNRDDDLTSLRSNTKAKESIIAGTDKKTRKLEVAESGGWSQRHTSLLKISCILVVATIYFSTSYWVEFGAIQGDLQVGSSKIGWTQYRMTQFIITVDTLRTLLTQSYTLNYLGGSPYMTKVTSSNVTTDVTFLVDIQNSLAFGDSARNILPPKGKLSDIMFSSKSCVAAPLYTPSLGCATFANGIVNDGIHSAILSSVGLVTASLNDFLNVNVSNYREVNSTINSNNFNILKTLQTTYLNDLSAYARKLSLNQPRETIDSLLIPRLVAIIIFISLVTAMYIFYFHPLIWSLNEEQKRTIAFLLLIPASIMEKMKSLRLFVEKLALDSNNNID